MSQGVLARGGDVPAAIEVECLEFRTSSCYFHYAGVCDAAASEVEYLEIRSSSSYIHHTGVCDVAAEIEVE